MAMSGGHDDGQPMMEMNTTPLIDVMLVLLIMLIFTLPVATHSIDIDLPQASNVPTENIDPIKNKIVLTPQDQILWNGTPITDNQLVANLQQTLTFAVASETKNTASLARAKDRSTQLQDGKGAERSAPFFFA